MYISLNYLIFFIALYFSYNLYQKGSELRDASIHMFFFSCAALLGGVAHHIKLEPYLISKTIKGINEFLPFYFHINPASKIFTRVWFLTFVMIGFTEYFFMRIFLYPLAKKFNFKLIDVYLKAMLAVFLFACLFVEEYSLVVAFHLVTHVLVIIFSLYIIFVKKEPSLWYLIALVSFNLVASAVWALMALKKIPSFGLHHNDWYHILIIIFIFLLHALLTKGSFASKLRSMNS